MWMFPLCRPNLIQNHLALVLYTLMSVDLFPAMCEVIVSGSAPLSVRTTILLGKIYFLFVVSSCEYCNDSRS